MKVVFFSLTGNVRRFIKRTNLEDTLEINNIVATQHIDEPYILVTGTVGFGEVPPLVQTFLDNNSEQLQGVAASGNRNWGQNFAKAGRLIADQYNVPLLMKFELHGTQQDTVDFRDKVVNFDANKHTKVLQSY